MVILPKSLLNTLVLPVFLILAFSTCDSGVDQNPGAVVRDSAGIRLARNSGPAGPSPSPRSYGWECSTEIQTCFSIGSGLWRSIALGDSGCRTPTRVSAITVPRGSTWAMLAGRSRRGPVSISAGRAARSLRSRPFGSRPSAGPAASEALGDTAGDLRVLCGGIRLQT